MRNRNDTKKEERKIHRATVRSTLRSLKNPEKAEILSGFLKTGPGNYGEGDRFLGIAVPDIRKIVRPHPETPKKTEPFTGAEGT